VKPDNLKPIAMNQMPGVQHHYPQTEVRRFAQLSVCWTVIAYTVLDSRTADIPGEVEGKSAVLFRSVLAKLLMPKIRGE